MQTSNVSRWVADLSRLLWPLWALAALAAAPLLASPADFVAASAAPSYRVLRLSTDRYAYGVDINARGQVAYTEHVGGVVRARLYDGRFLHDLGTLGGPNASTRALNDSGQVIGQSDVDRNGTLSHAYRWSPATGLVDLDAGSKTGSTVNDINERGQIAGAGWTSVAGALQYQAYFWNPQSGKVPVGSFGLSSTATALNNSGTVVGYAEGPGGGMNSILAFRWTRREGIRDIGTLPDEFTWATDINDAGQIVGATPFAPGEQAHAFVWTPRQGLRNLGTGSGERSSATRINNEGMVIGDTMSFEVPFFHGFVWTRGTGLIEFGADQPQTTTSASDVNRAGQVVGSFGGRALLWSRRHGVVDLNTRLAPAPRGLVLTNGVAISDTGAIVAASSTGLYLLIPRR